MLRGRIITSRDIVTAVCGTILGYDAGARVRPIARAIIRRAARDFSTTLGYTHSMHAFADCDELDRWIDATLREDAPECMDRLGRRPGLIGRLLGHTHRSGIDASSISMDASRIAWRLNDPREWPSAVARPRSAPSDDVRRPCGLTHQWFANGDHPQDECRAIRTSDGRVFLSEGEVVRRFRSPDASGGTRCERCGAPYHLHGWIDGDNDGETVCPGDFVGRDENGYFVAQAETARVVAS